MTQTTLPASPLEWVRKANPANLNNWADEWDQLGAALEQVFQRYVDAVTKVDGAFWEGKTAQAAHDRATADLKAVQTLADKLSAVAKLARQGVGSIDAPLRRARGLLAECDHNRWEIDPMSLTVWRTGNISGDETSRMATMDQELPSAIHDALAADIAVRDSLNKARNGLAIAFASPAALGTEQGKKDGSQLAKDPQHMSQDEIQRLIDAGHLTPEQIAALRSGNTATIPASQMEYINQISRSLDGKSPQEVQQLMDKLPPDAQKGLANSLQLISNNNVTSGIKNNPAIPEKGGSDLMPKKMLQSLDRKDLVESGWKFNRDGSTLQYSHLNGVADNQAIAKIAGAADPTLRYGSELDKKVLNDGAKYLQAQTSWEQNPQHNLISLTADGKAVDGHTALTEQFFKSVGDDKPAVQQLVAPDGKPNEQFFHDALTHQWSDKGQAVSTLFNFGDHHDIHNSVDAAASHQQAAIMSAFGQFAAHDNVPGSIVGGDDKWKLYDIPGTNHQSAGSLNPKLMQSLSHSMSPYVKDLTFGHSSSPDGLHVTDSNGDSWTTQPGTKNLNGSKNIFALMNTDSDAGNYFNASALGASLDQQLAYSNNPNDPHAAEHLTAAGQLRGLVDAGIRDDASAHINGQNLSAQDVYNHKKTAYDTISKIIGTSVTIGDGDDAVKAKLPFSDGASKVLSLGGDPLRDAIIGPAPTAHSTSLGLNPPDENSQAYTILQHSAIPDGLRHQYSDLFSTDGSLKSWNDIQSMPVDNTGTSTDRANEVSSLFNQLGLSNDNHQNAFLNGYNSVTGLNNSNDNTPHG